MRYFPFALLFLLLTQPATARVISTVERWQGEVIVDEPLRIAPQGTLIITPGTQVVASAGIEVAGRLQADGAELKGEDWPGLTLKGVGPETTLSGCRISGASTGITVIGGAPLLSGLLVAENRVGIELRQKSRATVENSLFRGNTRVGLFLKDEVSARIRNNRFEQQGKFGAYIYRSQPVEFRDNSFSENPTGLMIAHFGSNPLIEKNDFTDNQTGILVDRAAKPRLSANHFMKNAIGVDLFRRADPAILRNLFQGNQRALRIRYSSYPRIEKNDFVDNGKALVLAYQSSRWEEQKGREVRKERVGTQGAFGGRKKKQVTEEQRRARGLDGMVDARNNWWGKVETDQLTSLNKEANLEWIADGQDTPTFIDAGKSYPLDRVRWFPYSPHPWTEGDMK